jgi:prepilin-type N-terminal cleavage/methylation domain-containing protein
MKRLVRPGYTLVELVMVIVVGAILVGLVVNGASAYVSRKRVSNARDAFVYLAMRARSAAIERGRNVSLHLSEAQGRITVNEGCSASGAELERLHLENEFHAKVEAAKDPITVCYSPRGFAIEGQTTISAPTVVSFVIGKDTARARVAPLGQVEGVK